MLRWRQLALLPRSLGATHGHHRIGATTESSLLGAHSPLAARRTFLTDSRYSAVTASEFAHHLRAVGVSEEILHEFYKRKENPHLTSSNNGWIARSPQSFPIAVALSGGADSMALMLLLKEYLDAHNVQTPLLAITVDHRLRVESGDEARYVGDIASSKWGVRHVTMECNWGKEDDPRRGRNGTPRKSKLQEEARSFRYERLADACRAHNVKCLFVAHNLGDQLETVLFRLGRASGISGLAGMAAKKDFIPAESGHESVVLLRPLLEVPKPSLKATCERFHQPWVEDPSNESLVFDRIRIRQALECIQESTTGVEDLEALQVFQRIAATAKEEFDARGRKGDLRRDSLVNGTHVWLLSCLLQKWSCCSRTCCIPSRTMPLCLR
jgi:tRNA(Ile)-lysidine synthetase-like protein